MFIIKKNYYFYIDNIKLFNLNLVKKNLNITIIYRNNSKKRDSISEIINFKKKLSSKKISFYVANDLQLAKKCKADGLYISAYNKKFYNNIKVIGAAHNFREIFQKKTQQCKTIILSRLFKVNKEKKKSFFDVIKFNLISQKYRIKIIPLGGINQKNLLKLNLLNSDGFAMLSEIKKKPAISNRLF